MKNFISTKNGICEKRKRNFRKLHFVCSTIPSILGKTRKNKTMQNNNQKINKIKIKINRKQKNKNKPKNKKQCKTMQSKKKPHKF